MDKKHFAAAERFGAELVRSRDLDPVYVALLPLNSPRKSRTVLAYSCLYHLGVAGYVGERSGEDFWKALEIAAVNKDLRWPRGSERRHWRGKAAVEAVAWLRDNFEQPEQVIYRWYNGAHRASFNFIAEEVRRTPSFGPWIAFKVADIMERVLGFPVDFSDCELGIYREPRRAAALLALGDADAPISGVTLGEVIAKLLQGPLRKLKAPPNGDRTLNVQEIETVLCKYKSHCTGSYPLGKDTREVYHALSDPRWGQAKMKTALESLMEEWR